ncbi:hypothetical protein CGLO_06213 [Colletotrichum gloeosporioides Cg-14]|uniref:Uncharacterized protein n=1 Tax=Colletotrichum gloeosporioides (strain Cg-14) TaxID=1237896 RepID=T0LZP2_COLGC|nr:hypothetical protein CGLO_06213 [Colletotrichum gloeosporioides Cg-14]
MDAYGTNTSVSRASISPVYMIPLIPFLQPLSRV